MSLSRLRLAQLCLIFALVGAATALLAFDAAHSCPAPIGPEPVGAVTVVDEVVVEVSRDEALL
jgi:hypothetical protein